MNSAGSSSFWFHEEGNARLANGDRRVRDRRQGQGLREQIQHDGPRLANAHRKRSIGRWAASGLPRGGWPTPTTSTGFEWGKEELRWYVDGVLVRSVENTHWHQPLFLTFDSETMGEWMGMPDDEDLPSTFSVEYVRAWKRK